jgi:hypothetical protein
MSSDNDESLSSDNETNEIEEENTEEVVELSNEIPKKNNKNSKSKPKKRLVTSECGRQVIIQTKTKEKKKPIVVYLEDIIPEQEEPKVIVKTKRSRGRPKSKSIVEYVDKDGLPLTKKTKECKQTIINHGDVDKPLTDKELELIKLQERIVELENVSGKTILSTKKGRIDKRSTKPPTEKQLQQRKKFAEAAKARHAKIKADKEAKKQSETKDSVKAVVSELQQIKAQAQKEALEREKIKQQAIEEQKLKEQQEKNDSNPYGDDIFN